MVKFFTSFVFCEKFNFAKHFFEIQNEVILGDEIFSKNSKKPALDLLKGVKIKKSHNPSNIYDNSAQFHVAFQNLCLSSGSGPTGIGDEIKPKKTQKVAKLLIFKTPPKHLQGGKTAKFENMQIRLASGPSDKGLEKSIFQDPRIVRGIWKYPFF